MLAFVAIGVLALVGCHAAPDGTVEFWSITYWEHDSIKRLEPNYKELEKKPKDGTPITAADLRRPCLTDQPEFALDTINDYKSLICNVMVTAQKNDGWNLADYIENKENNKAEWQNFVKLKCSMDKLSFEHVHPMEMSSENARDLLLPRPPASNPGSKTLCRPATSDQAINDVLRGRVKGLLADRQLAAASDIKNWASVFARAHMTELGPLQVSQPWLKNAICLTLSWNQLSVSDSGRVSWRDRASEGERFDDITIRAFVHRDAETQEDIMVVNKIVIGDVIDPPDARQLLEQIRNGSLEHHQVQQRRSQRSRKRRAKLLAKKMGKDTKAGRGRRRCDNLHILTFPHRQQEQNKHYQRSATALIRCRRCHRPCLLRPRRTLHTGVRERIWQQATADKIRQRIV